MKKYTLLFAMAIMGLSLHAQMGQTYTEQFDSVFVNVSRTQAATGILYERVVPFANLTNFDSNVNALVDTSNYRHFIQSYSELYRAAFISSARLPHTVESFKEQAKSSASSNIVDVGMLHYNFNVMDSVVGKAKLIFGSDGTVAENLAVKASMYLQKTAFVAAPLSASVVGAAGITFRFNSSFKFDNTGTQLTLLRVDFGDGQGLRTVSAGTAVLVSYSLSGKKTLRFVATYSNGQTFTAYATIYYDTVLRSAKGNTSGWAYTEEDDITAKIAFTNYYSGQAPSGNYAQGYIRIYYANSDRKLRKPVLIVDGFDPENERQFETHDKGEASLWAMLGYGLPESEHVGKQLLNKGYDLVLLDLPDGGGYIERNAMVCIEVINEINRRLTTSGSKEEIVVVGPSMGGQITRYALAYMEQNSNANTNYGQHNCRLWVSFDSPHQGANISVGAQEFMYFYGYIGGEEEARNKYNSLINCVAARQMLKKHRDIYALSVYTQYYNNINAIGYPTNLRKVAVSNGSLNATVNGNGCEMALEAWKTVLGINFNATKIRYWPTSGSCEIFKGSYPEWFPRWWVIWELITHWLTVSADAGQYSIDGAPGCKYPTFKLVAAALANKVSNYSLPKENHCFMPTLSVLDVSGITYYLTDISSRNLVAEGKTPFNAYWGPLNKNMEHISFDADLVNWLYNEIETYIQGDKDIALNRNSTYTVHLPSSASSSTVINWTCSNNITIVSGQGTANVAVKGITSGEGWIRAETNNLTHSKLLKDFKVTVNHYVAPSTISQTTVWQNEYDVLNDMTVTNGASLTIKSNIYFAPNTKIIITPGSKLIVNGAKLTGIYSDKLWQGIVVKGTANTYQNEQTQGSVILTNATIENAIIAIDAASGNPTNGNGGIIKATGTAFINNVQAINYDSYENHNGTTISDNVGTFTQCTFSIKSNNCFSINGKYFNQHVKLNKVRGIKFIGCRFENLESHGGKGIFAQDAGFKVREYCSGGYTMATIDCRCPEKYKTPSVFKNLKYGIQSGNAGNPYDILIDQSEFTNNTYGISIKSSNNYQVTRNKFANIASLLTNIFGLGLESLSSSGYKIEENYFSTGVGILIGGSGAAENRIYKNSFNKNDRAIQAVGANAHANLATGLQFLCNSFKDNTKDIYVLAPYSIKGMQGRTDAGADNSFYSTLQSSLSVNNTHSIFYYCSQGSNLTPCNPSSNVIISTADANKCASTFCAWMAADTITAGLDSAYMRLQVRYDNFAAEFEANGYATVLANLNGNELSEYEMAALQFSAKMSEVSDQMRELSDNAISFILQDSMLNTDLLKQWYDVVRTPFAKYALAETHLFTGDYERADAVLREMPALFAFSDFETMEYDNYVQFHNFKKQLLLQGREWSELEDGEISTLQAIAEA
ncbi:MAG: hypothetical protein LBV41_03110, partial [Cytophagaceae bacterium]|nr:hypothetical protein [Cytophagaceae bacterium]